MPVCLWAEGVKAATGGLPFQQQRFRILQQFLDLDEEAYRFGAVHDAVIVGKRDVHHRAVGASFFVQGDRTELDLVHAEDTDLRCIENRRGQE